EDDGESHHHERERATVDEDVSEHGNDIARRHLNKRVQRHVDAFAHPLKDIRFNSHYLPPSSTLIGSCFVYPRFSTVRWFCAVTAFMQFGDASDSPGLFRHLETIAVRSASCALYQSTVWTGSVWSQPASVAATKRVRTSFFISASPVR